MPVRPFAGTTPTIARDVYIDPAATVIGEVTVGEGSSLWPCVVARGDVNTIVIGARSNIQDATILHVGSRTAALPQGSPLSIGNDVTIGHRAIVHGCTIGDFVLIGMGAIVMDGAELGDYTLLGAGSLVPEGKHLQGRSLWRGSPARRVRDLTDAECEMLRQSARHYAELAATYRGQETD
ncbi:MAG: gamma carbonic anhydrase family protein [Gammaproteobacteria bacterium]|nr:gamma carbonic anhydrase family protein [Gammaproteobacteria bacterium]